MLMQVMALIWWGEDLYLFDIVYFNGVYSIAPSGPTTDGTACVYGATTQANSAGCTYQRIYNPSVMQ